MFYFIKTPFWLKKLYSNCTWQMPASEKVIYLTFDDGPHPEVTPFVLDELIKYKAKATFFCIGKNVKACPEIYKRIILEGHAVGNHTFTHPNGWHTPDKYYLNDIEEAKKYIDSNLFRPPYGRITSFQLKMLSKPRYGLLPVMWSVLSGDFDKDITREKCLKNVINNTVEGSIVVFHDSEKAAERMKYALTGVLKHFRGMGYKFEKISMIEK